MPRLHPRLTIAPGKFSQKRDRGSVGEKRDRVIARQRATIDRLQATLDGVYLLADRMRAILAAHASRTTPPAELPIVLRLNDVAKLVRLSPATIRRGLQAGTFRPQPFGKYPYRWHRDEVLAHLRRRPDTRRRRHGFARKRPTTDTP